MLFHQFVNDDLGCASYLVGCTSSGEAVIVDPPYAIEPVLAEAKQRDVRIVRVLETHTHADHVSGHGRLALEHGIPVSIHPAAEVEFDHDPIADGDEITIGNVTLRCIHTPGHRPEHSCFAVIDRTRADEPWLLLTGDSLFVGDTARPDLAVDGVEGAEGMFHSLHRLLELSDGVEVFPGHVAGSLCGKGMSPKASTTLGFERRFNPMLQISEVDAFVAESSSISAPRPPNINRIVALNRGPLLGAPPPVEELTVPAEGSQLLDVRPLDAYLAGHRPGSYSVPVSGPSFATKAGFVLDADRSVTIVATSAGEAERAAHGLHSVAVLDVPGFVLTAGSETMASVPIDDLDEALTAGVELIDVREKDERDSGYIAGSRNVPYRLISGCCPDLPKDRPLVTICEAGPRAAVAASVLAAKGYDARPVLGGGVADWRDRGGATVEFRRCGSH